jgi:hypothetical protein
MDALRACIHLGAIRRKLSDGLALFRDFDARCEPPRSRRRGQGAGRYVGARYGCTFGSGGAARKVRHRT